MCLAYAVRACVLYSGQGWEWYPSLAMDRASEQHLVPVEDVADGTLATVPGDAAAHGHGWGQALPLVSVRADLHVVSCHAN